MKRYKVLILTDHSNHTSENSLYELAVQLLKHKNTVGVDVASRANPLNSSFFNCQADAALFVSSISHDFQFDKKAHPLDANFNEAKYKDYDLIWLRMPPPLSKELLDYISMKFKDQVIINRPDGIHTTGSKEFLVEFQSVCPPLQLIRSMEDIVEFKKNFAIVLKPFRAYGGAGIVRIEDNRVWSGKDELSFMEFQEQYQNVEYLAVKYLKNVHQGDKRIIVVNGEVLGASLRLPAEGSWICNVSMGGSSNKTSIAPEEFEMIEKINPKLKEMGIVMYGIDTLVGDDGKRVLSELNTTSIGGLPQIARMNQEPLVEKAIDLIWQYYEEYK